MGWRKKPVPINDLDGSSKCRCPRCGCLHYAVLDPRERPKVGPDNEYKVYCDLCTLKMAAPSVRAALEAKGWGTTPQG